MGDVVSGALEGRDVGAALGRAIEVEIGEADVLDVGGDAEAEGEHHEGGSDKGEEETDRVALDLLGLAAAVGEHPSQAEPEPAIVAVRGGCRRGGSREGRSVGVGIILVLRFRRVAGSVGDVTDEGGFEVVGTAAGHELGRGVAGQDGPGVHQGDAVAAQGLVHEVSGDEDRDALAAGEVDQELPELVAGDGVDPGGGLIEQEHVGLVQNGDGQGQPLLEPQGKLLRGGFEIGAEAEPIDEFVDPGAGTVAGKVEDTGVELEVLTDRELAVEGEGLRHVADALARGQVVGVHGITEELGLALGGGEEPGQHLHRGRLSAAVGAEETEDLAAADGEVDAVHGGEGAKPLGEVGGLDCRLPPGVDAGGDLQGVATARRGARQSATNASSRFAAPVRSMSWPGVPVAMTRPASMAMVQSKRWASSM